MSIGSSVVHLLGFHPVFLLHPQVSKLRAELQGDDYKVKLGGLVSQLYKLAFQTYHDIPRGPIKVKDSARWYWCW